MPLVALDVRGYRSLYSISFPLGPLNVVTGPNGAGKSNLYRSLWLLSQLSNGSFAKAICKEGGFLSAMWAGPRTSKKPLLMHLGFQWDDLRYEIECGFPPIGTSTAFPYDPVIKSETVWIGGARRPANTLLERGQNYTWVRDIDGNRVEYLQVLDTNESALAQLQEPHRFPELLVLREALKSWRFYHAFRTDEGSPIRAPQVSVKTPVLSHDGSDLAAALQTIIEFGDSGSLSAAISEGFPGRELQIAATEPLPYEKSPLFTELSVAMKTPGVARRLLARELSDGTLKFLCLVAALLSPRPPSLIALNEPESSLHPDLLAPLGKLIVEASRYSQVWVTSHSQALVGTICRLGNIQPISLALQDGKTAIVRSE